MPFRFKKSFKIAPGIRINLSKSGISTSIGKRGASVNLSKRGTRLTTGIPGSGLSISKLFGGRKKGEVKSETPVAPHQVRLQPSNPPQKNKIPFIPVKGTGCLYFLFVLPFILVINLYILLFAGLWYGGKALWKVGNASPRNRKISLGVIGVMSVMGVISSFASSGGDPVPPTPTLDLVSVNLTALAQAWQPYTQTAQAAVTDTPLPTQTLVPTETATLEPLPTATLEVFPTVTTFLNILPINQSPTSPPAGQSAVCSCAGDTYNCGDFGGSWSAAQACFNYCQSHGAGDIHRLDGNNDGSACDSLK